MAEDFPKLIVISGPTCSGKSALAVELAQLLGAEIINADSMQVYRGMNIGTAKLPVSERKGVPHHLIDIVNPDQEFNAALFQCYALTIIKDLHKKNTPVIVVGGTGLYVKTLLRGLSKAPPSNSSIRQTLTAECKKRGPSSLHQRLSRLDKSAAESIHPMDRSRIVRALEVIHLTGYPFSEVSARHGFSERRFQTLNLCLEIDRQILYCRINRRTETMIEAGLINEVEQLLEIGYSPEVKPMQAIGYRQIVAFLKGRYGLEEAKELIQRDTRRYAKRQLTWFKADPEITWVNPDNKQTIIHKVVSFIKGTS